MINGKKIYLTAIEKKDLPKLMDWRNREDFRKHFREHREINIDMQEKWYESKVLSDPNTIMFAIRSTQDHELLGCCGLCYINWVHRQICPCILAGTIPILIMRDMLRKAVN